MEPSISHISLLGVIALWKIPSTPEFENHRKVKNFKKWLLHGFSANMHKNEKFAANAVN